MKDAMEYTLMDTASLWQLCATHTLVSLEVEPSCAAGKYRVNAWHLACHFSTYWQNWDQERERLRAMDLGGCQI